MTFNIPDQPVRKKTPSEIAEFLRTGGESYEERKQKNIAYHESVIDELKNCPSFKSDLIGEDYIGCLTRNAVFLIEKYIEIIKCVDKDYVVHEYAGMMHRQFCSDAFLSIECLTMHLAKELGLEVRSRDSERAKSLSDILSKAAINIPKDVNKWLSDKIMSTPVALDYFHAVLKHIGMNRDEIEDWKNDVDALRVLRNKCSHGTPEISEAQKGCLIKANLPVEVDVDDHLMFSARFYVPIVKKLEEFSRRIVTLMDKT